MVPRGHGVWLGAHIPDVDSRLREDEGHLTLVAQRVPDVHEWLAARYAG